MKKFISATNDETYSGEYINPEYIIKLGTEMRMAVMEKSSGETSVYPTTRYWIKVDDGGKSVLYYIDGDTYGKLVNMER